MAVLWILVLMNFPSLQEASLILTINCMLCNREEGSIYKSIDLRRA